jgi:hypothetical protein
VGTVLGSAAIALLVATGSFVGLRSILRDQEPFQTAVPGYEVYQRTATIEAFTVTSPSDWFLVNEWPRSMQIAVGSASTSKECTVAPGVGPPVCTQSEEITERLEPPPYGLPMLQLSNIDSGLDAIACGDELPAGAAVLYVGLDYQRAIAGVADPSIKPFPPDPGPPEQGTGPCGSGGYAHYTVHGEPFFTWVGLGSSVTDEDRATVLTAYEMMSADDAWEPAQPDAVTPAYVIAGGVTAEGDDWRLELRPFDRNVEMTLIGVTPWGAQSDFAVPGMPIEWCCMDDGLIEVTFGAVSKDATGVEVRPTDGSPSIPGTIAPLPPSMPFDFDLFFIEGTVGLSGEVVALGLEGGTNPPPVATPRGEVVDLSGSLLGQDWTARFTGAFADRTACIRVTIGETNEPLCPEPLETSLAGDQPSMHVWVTEHLALLAGSVPPEVVEIRFTSDDGTSPPTQFQCQMGPLGWTDPDRRICAVALPAEGSGIFEYVDADGDVLFEEGTGWGAATAASNELPWTNEDNTITATGFFQEAEWKVEVLNYLAGYRLTIDGRTAFEGRVSEGEPMVFPVSATAAGNRDAIVLVLTGTDVQRVSVTSGTTWEGRWLPGANANGAEARLWLLELPDEGSAPLLIDGVEQGQVTWP